MTMLSKRGWAPGLKVKEESSILLQWMERSAQKNVLSRRPPTLYEAYLCDGMESVAFMHDVSSLFRWSSKDTPAVDAARDAVVRLLSVCLKMKFFSAKEDRSRHEPYFFVIPDLSNPERNRFGVVLRLDESRKSIVVAECDMAQCASGRVFYGRFPVVLGSDFSSWVDLDAWESLSKQGTASSLLKPWERKKEKETVDAWTNVKDFPFGRLFDVPFHLKDAAKDAGMIWAQGVQRWYLPHGFDMARVAEYMDYLEKTKKPVEQEFRGSETKKSFLAVALHELQE